MRQKIGTESKKEEHGAVQAFKLHECGLWSHHPDLNKAVFFNIVQGVITIWYRIYKTS